MSEKLWQMIVVHNGKAAATMLGCSRELVYDSVRAFNAESERLNTGARAFPCVVSVTPDKGRKRQKHTEVRAA